MTLAKELQPTLTELLEWVAEGLIEEVDGRLPNEAVGLLCEDGTILSLINQARSPDRFEVSNRLVHEAITEAVDRGYHPLAIYHSHPTKDSWPSKRDDVMMELLAEVPFVIVGIDGIAAWMWEDGETRFITKVERYGWDT